MLVRPPPVPNARGRTDPCPYPSCWEEARGLGGSPAARKAAAAPTDPDSRAWLLEFAVTDWDDVRACHVEEFHEFQHHKELEFDFWQCGDSGPAEI